MSRQSVQRLSLAGALALSGCAYIGEPLPPALNIPVSVADLDVRQRAAQLVIRFTPPAVTTEGLIVPKNLQAEIRIGTYTQPFNPAAWEATATVLPDEPLPLGNPQLTVDATPWIGQEVAVGVRYRNAKGRSSGWSNIAGIRVREPLAPPAGLEVRAAADGIRLSWIPSAPAFRVYRGEELIATVTRPEYLDPLTEPGTRAEYQIEAIDGLAESERGSPVAIVYQDRFPPDAPAGLVAIAGVRSMELAWERSTAADLGFYRVYRDGRLIADQVSAPTFSDSAVRSGDTYRYEVTAVDSRQNESGRSAAVEIRFP